MKSHFLAAARRDCCVILFLSLLCHLSLAPVSQAHEEWYRALDLESAVGKASLVLAARVVEVTETKLTLGGKVERSLQQFQFDPIQVLKGVFSRDRLLLTSDDLGGYRFGNATRQIERGQVRLLILERSSQGFAVHPSAPSLDQSLPRLRDEKDPLIDAVKLLLSASGSHDRARKVELLLVGLDSVNGPAGIPLLISLQRRALLAAQTSGSVPKVARYLNDNSPAVREAAARMLQSLLEADYLSQQSLHQAIVEALAAALERIDTNAAARVAAIDALGAGGTETANHELARTLLQLRRPCSTFAERAAQLRAVGRLKMKSQQSAVLALLDQLQLDAPAEIQQAAAVALAQLDPNEAGRQLRAGIDKKFAAGQQVYTEIHALGELLATAAVPLLVEVSELALDWMEEVTLVTACAKIADPRLVPLLARRLDPDEPEMRQHAVDALKKIDTTEAAKALQPHLQEEANLLRKLEIAEFLGRHGIADGYAFAIEHMSEPSLREKAVTALATIRTSQASEELRKILESSNDLAWNAAAVLALGRLGEKELAPRFLEMTEDLKNPLAPAALQALGYLGEGQALAKVREGLNSRNAGIVAASADAAGRLLALPSVQANDVRDQLASLLADADASQEARAAALSSLLALNDRRLEMALAKAERDAGLEETPLLEQIEKQLRVRKVKLALSHK